MKRASALALSLGVDVCKFYLDACVLFSDGKKEERRFRNDASGIASLLSWGVSFGVPVLGMESTGGYERNLALAGSSQGIPVRVENPRRIKDFARASGRVNKTDRADARAIAEFLSKMEGRPWRLAASSSRELEGLTQHRASLVAESRRHQNRLEHRETMPDLAVRQTEARLVSLKKDLAEVELERRRLIASDPSLSRDFAALVRLRGVGEEVAALVLARAGNIEDYPNAQSYAASAGVAPCRRESGEWRGKSRISKRGDAALRSGLFLPALCAARYDPVLKEFRARLLANGKTKLQAAVACIRKLLMRIYGILKAVRAGKEPYYGEKPDLTPQTP